MFKSTYSFKEIKLGMYMYSVQSMSVDSIYKQLNIRALKKVLYLGLPDLWKKIG